MSPEREPIRLLVVDDDDAYRTRLCRAFRDRGLAVEGASSLAEAKTRVASFRPQRAVLDLRLGDGSGIDLLGELLALDPEIACVVLTGYGSIATAVDAVRRGAIDYLTKPADADEILLAFASRANEAPVVGDTSAPARSPAVPSLHRVEWEHIQRVLTDCGGNISEAARQLGMHRRTLQRKLATRPPNQ
jgi:two-component system response regulator RegA